MFCDNYLINNKYYNNKNNKNDKNNKNEINIKNEKSNDKLKIIIDNISKSSNYINKKNHINIIYLNIKINIINNYKKFFFNIYNLNKFNEFVIIDKVI